MVKISYRLNHVGCSRAHGCACICTTYMCTTHGCVYVYTCRNMGITTWFSTQGSLSALMARKPLHLSFVEVLKGQVSTGRFERSEFNREF